MVVGFNHNFRYRDRVFHIQTEDGGVRSPHITTLVYCGGTILASKKTSYADITKVSNLHLVVEELMKEQHKEMLRRLRDGDFDAKIDALFGGVQPVPEQPGARQPPSAAPAAPAARSAGAESRVGGTVSSGDAAPKTASEPQRSGLAPASAAGAPSTDQTSPSDKPETPSREPETPALDDIILSYLAGDDDK